MVAAINEKERSVIVVTVHEPDQEKWDTNLSRRRALDALICKKVSTEAGTTTVTLERSGLIMVIKGVPAQVCKNCGEAYVDEKVASELLASAEKAAKAEVEVEVREYLSA